MTAEMTMTSLTSFQEWNGNNYLLTADARGLDLGRAGALAADLSVGAQIGINTVAGGCLGALGQAAQYGGNCPNWGEKVAMTGLYGSLLGGATTAAGAATQSYIENTFGTVGSYGDLSLPQQLNMNGVLQGNLPSVSGVAQGVGNGVSIFLGSSPTP